MIFQSLGSNYDFKFALKALFTRGKKKDSDELCAWLENRYGGTAVLYAKGRDALSSAIDTITPANQAPRVAINALTCSVVVQAVTSLDGIVTYLDVERDGNFSVQTLANAFVSKNPPKIIVVQNTYGQPCDITAIEQYANKHKAILIEDLAHSIGQKYADGREVGTVGDFVMLSFGRDKIIDVVNGGALIVRNKRFLHRVDYPDKRRPGREEFRDRIYPMLTWKVRVLYRVGIGRFINSTMYAFGLARRSADGHIHRSHKMPNWQSRLALIQLKTLDDILSHRRTINAIYKDVLGKAVITEDAVIRTPVALANPKLVLARLAENGYLLHDTWYDTPVGPARKYLDLDYPEKLCPHAVTLSRHIINLPTHHYVSEQTATRIAMLIKELV